MHFSEEWFNKRMASLRTEDEKLHLMMSFVNSSSDWLDEFCDSICKQIAVIAEERNDQGLRAFLEVHDAYRQLAHGNVAEFGRRMRIAEKLAVEAPVSPPANISIQMCAFMYWNAGEREKAFELAYFARRQMEGDMQEGLGWSDFQLGVFHCDLKDHEISRRYFQDAEAVAITNPDLGYQLARIRSGLGALAISENNLDAALHYNQLALEGYRECGHLTALSRALNDLGVIYFRNGDSERAKSHLSEAMEIRKTTKYIPGLITTEIELAKIYMSENALPAAEQLLNEALALSKSSGSRQKAITCMMMLADVYKARNEFAHALRHLEEGYRLKTELSGEEATNKVKHLQQKWATELADREAEIHRQKNAELKKAYDAIEEQNKSILDSITYAKRIQTALLGSRTLISKFLPDNFILYKPKDIVSGDFWWCAEESGRLYFAIADCTGHGVPGAFMSLLNINLLNRALNENPEADVARLLDEVRKQVILSLNRDGIETARDGMDVVLCCFDPRHRTLEFACANNSLSHIRGTVQTVYNPDKFPVGLSHSTDLTPFTLHRIQLEKGDHVYLSTDGFADQFGGEKGKKFKQKRLRELLLQNAGLPMNAQEQALDNAFEAWKGKLEQVDDVLVMGFRC